MLHTSKAKFFCLALLAVWLAACTTIFPFSPTETPVPPPTRTPAATFTPLPTPTPTEQPLHGVVTLWHSLGESELSALVEIMAGFRELYPDVHFDVLYIPVADLPMYFERAASEGGGPAVVLGPAEWGATYFNAGLTSDLTELAQPGLLEALNQPALVAAQYQGALTGLPFSLEGVVLYRNKQIIPDYPATFDELKSLAKAATQGDVIGAMLERSFYFSGGQLYGIGGSWMDENGNPTFNNETGLAWVELLRALEQAGPPEFSSDRDLEFFKAGKVGFVIDGTWSRTALADAIGADNLVIDPWPAYEDGYLSGFVRSQNVYLTSQVQGDNREAAWEFIQYFLSPESQARLANAGTIPAAGGTSVSNPLTAQAIIALAGGAVYPPIAEAAAYPAALDAALQAIFYNGVAPEEALQKAEADVLVALEQIRSATTP